MSSIEKRLRQCRKPTGDLGRTIGMEMNERHFELWNWGLDHISIRPDANILDVGCGGGRAVNLLAGFADKGKVYGIDYSEEMVGLARQVNATLIEQGRVEIEHGSVSDLPFEDDMFDLACAFETYYFWPELDKDLEEIFRVLKPDGTFIMVNEVYKHEDFEERNRLYADATGLNYHTPDEYLEFLSRAGFSSVRIHTIPEKNWITAVAKKE